MIDKTMENCIETLIYSDDLGLKFQRNIGDILDKFSYWSEKNKFIDKALGLIFGFFIGELFLYEEKKYYLAVEVINKIIEINEINEVIDIYGYFNSCLDKNPSFLSIVALMGVINIKFPEEAMKLSSICYGNYTKTYNEDFNICWIYGNIFYYLLSNPNIGDLKNFLQKNWNINKNQIDDDNKQLTLLILETNVMELKKKEEIWDIFNLFTTKNSEIFVVNGAIIGSFLGYNASIKPKLSLIDFTTKTDTNFRNHPLNLLSLIKRLIHQYKPNKNA